MTPAVARERARCVRVCRSAEAMYAHIAEKAKKGGDDTHRLASLARQWAAQEIRQSIEKGSRP